MLHDWHFCVLYCFVFVKYYFKVLSNVGNMNMKSGGDEDEVPMSSGSFQSSIQFQVPTYVIKKLSLNLPHLIPGYLHSTKEFSRGSFPTWQECRGAPRCLCRKVHNTVLYSGSAHTDRAKFTMPNGVWYQPGVSNFPLQPVDFQVPVDIRCHPVDIQCSHVKPLVKHVDADGSLNEVMHASSYLLCTKPTYLT